MSDTPIWLTNPAVPQAATDLANYQRWSRVRSKQVELCFLAAGAVWFSFFPGLALVLIGPITLGMVAQAFILLSGGLTWWYLRRIERRYRRHLAAGDIALLDPYLTEVWDELVAESEAPMDHQQRHEYLSELFYAARDLAPELAQRANVLTADDAESRTMAEARIRVRLLQDIKPILAVLITQAETQKQIEALTPDWADADEVEEQLAILRERTAAAEADRASPALPDTPGQDTPGQDTSGQDERSAAQPTQGSTAGR